MALKLVSFSCHPCYPDNSKEQPMKHWPTNAALIILKFLVLRYVPVICFEQFCLELIFHFTDRDLRFNNISIIRGGDFEGLDQLGKL